MITRYESFLESKITIISSDKIIDYENGFTCEYKIKNGKLIDYLFKKNELVFEYLKNNPPYFKEGEYIGPIEHKKIRDSNIIKLEKEKEIEEFEDFEKLYHYRWSENYISFDHKMNIISGYLEYDTILENNPFYLNQKILCVNNSGKNVYLVKVLLPQKILNEILSTTSISNWIESVSMTVVPNEDIRKYFKYKKDFLKLVDDYLKTHSKKYNILY